MSAPASNTGGAPAASPVGARDEVRLRRITNRLIVSLREDVAAHRRVKDLLGIQEVSVTRPSSAEFREATEALERELERLPFRSAQRDRHLKDLGSALGVQATSLTLASAAERLGSELGELLLVERETLLRVVEEVSQANRRVAVVGAIPLALSDLGCPGDRGFGDYSGVIADLA
ncbi:MAG: hypothetical protein AAGG01_05430, partial [Planctomycetota bacterium]